MPTLVGLQLSGWKMLKWAVRAFGVIKQSWGGRAWEEGLHVGDYSPVLTVVCTKDGKLGEEAGFV